MLAYQPSPHEESGLRLPDVPLVNMWGPGKVIWNKKWNSKTRRSHEHKVSPHALWFIMHNMSDVHNLHVHLLVVDGPLIVCTCEHHTLEWPKPLSIFCNGGKNCSYFSKERAWFRSLTLIHLVRAFLCVRTCKQYTHIYVTVTVLRAFDD